MLARGFDAVPQVTEGVVYNGYQDAYVVPRWQLFLDQATRKGGACVKLVDWAAVIRAGRKSRELRDAVMAICSIGKEPRALVLFLEQHYPVKT